MKRTLIVYILLTAMMCSALGCHATPEELAVQNKGNTEAAFEKTYSGSSAISEYLNSGEKIEKSVTGERGNKLLLDAEVVVPAVEKLPVVSVTVDKISEEAVKKTAQQFFGEDTKYYEVSGPTKEYYEQRISEIEDEIVLTKKAIEEHDEDYTIDSVDAQTGEAKEETVTKKTLEEDLHKIEEDLERYKELIATYEEKPLTETQLIYKEHDNVNYEEECISATAKLNGKDYLIHTSRGGYALEIGRIDPQSYEMAYPVVYDNYSEDNQEEFAVKLAQEEAEKLSCDFVKEIDDSFVLGKVYKSGCSVSGYEDGWKCCFTRVVSGVEIGYDDHQIDVDGVSNPLYYESLDVIVSDDGIIAMQWQYPSTVKETVNDNVEPLAFDKIAEIIEKQLTGYINQTMETPQNLLIDKIELSMMRIKKVNSENEFYLVPVWDCYGKQTDENSGGQQNVDNFSFLTVNALDGSIINRSLGY